MFSIADMEVCVKSPTKQDKQHPKYLCCSSSGLFYWDKGRVEATSVSMTRMLDNVGTGALSLLKDKKNLCLGDKSGMERKATNYPVSTKCYHNTGRELNISRRVQTKLRIKYNRKWYIMDGHCLLL